MVWIDYKKAFDSICQECILKVLILLKMSPVIIIFLNYNIKRWYINVRLIHEKNILETNNLNINNGIFHGDSLSPLPFCITRIFLSVEHKNTAYGYKSTTTKKNKPPILYG